MTSCLTRYTHPAKTYMGKAFLGAPINLEEGLLQTDPRFPPQVHRKLDFTSSGDYGAIVGVENPYYYFFFLFHFTGTTFSGSQALSRLCNSNTTSFCSEDSKAGSSEASMSVQSPGSLQQPSGRGSSRFSRLTPHLQKPRGNSENL